MAELTMEQQEEAARLYAALSENAETRPGLLGLLKKLDPKAVIPELDAANALEAKLAAQLEESRARTEKLEERLGREAAERTVEKSRAALRAKGATDADIEAVEKMMEESNKERGEILTHSTAFALYNAQRQSDVAAPTFESPRVFDVPKDEEMLADPQGVARREAAKVIHELRMARRA